MYPRLRLARNLLTSDGVIFISIDDNEVENLKKICSEVFGESNFLECLIILNNKGGRSDSKNFAKTHEYVLVYQKSDNFKISGLPLTDQQKSAYKRVDSNGVYKLQALRKGGSKDRRIDRPNMYYPIYYDSRNLKISVDPIDEFSVEIYPLKSDGSEGRWRWGRDTFKKKKDFLTVKLVSKRNRYDVYEKVYMKEDIKMKSFESDRNYTSSTATSKFKSIFSEKIFDFPKSMDLIKDLVTVANTKKDDIILDFFAGSSTTAHAVLDLNREDGGNRRFIMVQLPEKTDESSEAFKAGYSTIAEIGKERIRRVIRKMKEDYPDKSRGMDLGFKVFKLDSSNIKSWDGNPDNLESELLSAMDNIKTDRTDVDILYEILLKYGLDLALPVEERVIGDKRVYNVGYGSLFICLGDNITSEVAEGIGKWKQECDSEVSRVVFKDNGLTDVEKTNSFQTLKRFGINDVKSI